MPSEERVMRAREVLAAEFVSRSPGYLDLPSSNLVSVDCAIAAMLTFSDEGSGIGESRRPLSRAEKDVMLAYMERHCPHRAKETAWDAVSAFNAIFTQSPPDIDHAGLGTDAK